MSFHVSLVACRWTVSQLVMQREEQALNHPLDMVAHVQPWTVSQLVMQREEQALNHPLDMVAHVQPWMLIPIVPLIIVFEGAELSYDTVLYYNGHYAPMQVAMLIACGGLLAFCMELSEYLLLVNTSGITLNIFGILKVSVNAEA
ncbi:unnamed protein product [Heligmosomoides polygyrus]|uniref:Transmembrane protein 17B n=1 Tax=Heligmosomoides polygyrus TaxID=6339 RepID=A0A183FXE9_HELPZ|nr:unnamed protein product [Heligmosomoides polygyrus]